MASAPLPGSTPEERLRRHIDVLGELIGSERGSGLLICSRCMTAKHANHAKCERRWTVLGWGLRLPFLHPCDLRRPRLHVIGLRAKPALRYPPDLFEQIQQVRALCSYSEGMTSLS